MEFHNLFFFKNLDVLINVNGLKIGKKKEVFRKSKKENEKKKEEILH